MCLQQHHQPVPEHGWCYIRAVGGAGNIPAQFTQHTGTETPPLAVCLSCCIPFPLGKFSISNELFTNDNYLWK